MTNKIKSFEKDMHKTLQKGYFTNIIRTETPKGLELFLPGVIDEHRANLIASHLRNKYQIQSIYFIRSHSIKVFYEEQ